MSLFPSPHCWLVLLHPGPPSSGCELGSLTSLLDCNLGQQEIGCFSLPSPPVARPGVPDPNPVHAHGGLAAIECWVDGMRAALQHERGERGGCCARPGHMKAERMAKPAASTESGKAFCCCWKTRPCRHLPCSLSSTLGQHMPRAIPSCHKGKHKIAHI